MLIGKTLFQAAAAAALFAPWSVALAQDGEEIVVTANRQEQLLTEVPMSISALSGDELTDMGVTDTMALQHATPGLVVNQNANFSQPYIRGIGTDITTPGGESSVATYIDDVYQTTPYLGVQILNAVHRVEVLRGPQGALYGRNATGGAINIITRAPPEEFEADASLTVGDYNLFNAQGYVGGPLTEGISANLAVAYQDRDGYGRSINTGEDYNDSHYEYIRGRVLFEPIENLTILIGAQHLNIEGGAVGYTYFDNYGSTPLTGGNVTINSQDIYSAYPYAATANIDQASMRIRYEGNSFTFTSVTGFSQMEADLFPDYVSTDVAVFDFAARIEDEAFTQDFLLTGGGDRFSWLAGISYLNDQPAFAPNLVILGTTPASATFATVESESLAGFVQGTLAVTDRLDVTVGARYTRDEKTQTRLDVYDGVGTLLSSTPGGSDSWNNLSYRIVADYDFDWGMLYARIETGFKSGTVNALVANDFVPPEVVTSYEIGFRARVSDALSLSGAIFHYDYEDLQSQYVDPLSGSPFVQTAPAATINGAELAAEWRATDNLSFSLGVNWLDSQFDEFISIGSYVPNIGGGNTIAPGVDVAGNRLTRSPEFTYNVGMAYNQPFASGEIDFGLQYFWSDDYFFDVTNRVYQEAYGVLNGRLGYTFENGLNVAVWGRNLTDEDYIQAISISNFGDSGQLAAPRQIGATLSMEF